MPILKIVQRTEGKHGLHVWTDWAEMSDGKIRCFVAVARDGMPLYVGSSYECDAWLAGHAHAIEQSQRAAQSAPTTT